MTSDLKGVGKNKMENLMSKGWKTFMVGAALVPFGLVGLAAYLGNNGESIDSRVIAESQAAMEYITEMRFDAGNNEIFGAPAIDDYIKRYVDGHGTIRCKEEGTSKVYNLIYSNGEFIVSPAPLEAKGSHYIGNIDGSQN